MSASRPTIFAALALLAQLFSLLYGARFIGSDGNPVVLTLVSLALPLLFLQMQQRLTAPETAILDTKNSGFSNYIGASIGVLSVFALVPLYKIMLAQHPDISINTDVLVQLKTLYTRFAAHQNPYQPVTAFSWAPFPAYMPLHWLPIGITEALHIDMRWTSFIGFAAAMSIYGYCIAQYYTHLDWYKKAIIIALPAAALGLLFISFFDYKSQELTCCTEPLVAAYYAILMIGLLFDKRGLTAFGIAACLLSRYTFVFWLPLFALLYYKNKSLKDNIIVWATVVVAVLALYVLPFMSQDWHIFQKSVTYHNECATSFWKEGSIFRYGLCFARYFSNIHSIHNITIMRVVQIGLCLLASFGGYFWYQKRARNLPFGKFAAACLLLNMIIFYAFAPFAYMYYFVVTVVLAAILLGQMYAEELVSQV